MFSEGVYTKLVGIFAELHKAIPIAPSVGMLVVERVEYILEFYDLFDVNFVPDPDYDSYLLAALLHEVSASNLRWTAPIAKLLFERGFSQISENDVSQAVHKGDFDTVLLIVEYQPEWLMKPLNINTRNSILAEAIIADQPRMVQMLLEKRIALAEAPIDDSNGSGDVGRRHPFFLAAELSRWNCMHAMLCAFKQQKMDCRLLVTQRDSTTGKTPLHVLARKRGSVFVAEKLVELGADPLALDEKGRSPALIAELHGQEYYLSIFHRGPLSTNSL